MLLCLVDTVYVMLSVSRSLYMCKLNQDIKSATHWGTEKFRNGEKRASGKKHTWKSHSLFTEYSEIKENMIEQNDNMKLSLGGKNI